MPSTITISERENVPIIFPLNGMENIIVYDEHAIYPIKHVLAKILPHHTLTLKMKKFFKNITQKLTAADNYNTEQILQPLKDMQNISDQLVTYQKKYVQNAIEAIQNAITFLKSEQFQFKDRLIADIIQTNYLGKVVELFQDVEYKKELLTLFNKSVNILLIYKDSVDLYNHMLNTALILNQYTQEYLLLNSCVIIIDLQNVFKQDIPEKLYSSIINYAQVNKHARKLIFQRPTLFNKEEVLVSLFAGIKNELTILPFDKPVDKILTVITDIFEMLQIASKFMDFSKQTDVDNLLTYTTGNAFTLINKVCFDNKVNVQQQLTNFQELQFENKDYCAEIIYLIANFIKMFRDLNINLFKQAIHGIMIQSSEVFNIVKNENFIQIKTLSNSEYQFNIQQLILLAVMYKTPVTNETLIIIDQILNVHIQILSNGYFGPQEVVQSGQEKISECYDSLQCIEVVQKDQENDNLNTSERIKKYLDLEGPIIKQSDEYYEIAQFSAGLKRNQDMLLKIIPINDTPKNNITYTANPILQMLLNSIVIVCQFIHKNDFSGDDASEMRTVITESGTVKMEEHHNYEFTEKQINHLCDFYEASAEFLYQLNMANPVYYKFYLKDHIINYLIDSLKKLTRFVSFVKANHSIFFSNKTESVWLQMYPKMMNAIINGEKRMRASSCGYMLDIIKQMNNSQENNDTVLMDQVTVATE